MDSVTRARVRKREAQDLIFLENEDGLDTSFDREAFAHRLINNDKVEIRIPHFT